VLVGLLFVALYGSLIFLVLLVPYWLIRLAVRHGIEDAWVRRSKPKL
jgi:hypothetical protein